MWPGHNGTTILQIVLNTPQKSLVNQATQKILAKFSYPASAPPLPPRKKKPEIQNFKSLVNQATQKILAKFSYPPPRPPSPRKKKTEIQNFKPIN